MNWWKVSKCGWAHRRHTSLTKEHKILLPDMTSASIPAVSTLRSSLSMYTIFLYNNCFFSLLVLLTAQRRLLSK
jgi:hypothetical protein